MLWEMAVQDFIDFVADTAPAELEGRSRHHQAAPLATSNLNVARCFDSALRVRC
jgi:hypothetical protein